VETVAIFGAVYFGTHGGDSHHILCPVLWDTRWKQSPYLVPCTLGHTVETVTIFGALYFGTHGGESPHTLTLL
jgi:tetrahydromethanopterin S-methyltransferase subunit D